MSTRSNDQGRAYEYVCLITLHHEINKYRPAVIETNSSYLAAQRAWNAIDDGLRSLLAQSADAAIDALFELEPLIIERSHDTLTLKLQRDTEGESGDVRDILIIRCAIKWEIGLSIKHNHFAVKHSRLSKNLDFGEKWFGIPCSGQYWRDINPVFQRLQEAKNDNCRWSDIGNKDLDVYRPILTAFINEVKRCNAQHGEVPRKMVEYLLGEYDFYKVISVDSQRTTQIHTYNTHGTLNHSASGVKPKRQVPIATLPTRIVSIDFKPNSNTTVELYMDNGWQFSFRIHNASTMVETSLKFDIQIIGMPTSIMVINCTWR